MIQNKIQQEAEKRYPTVSSRPIKKLVNEGKQEIFIAGATYEQERSKVLVEALEHIKKMTNSSAVRIAIIKALNIYSDEKG